MRPDLDTIIREGLAEDAAGVTADDHLLERINDAIGERRRRPPARRALLVAAAALVVVGLATSSNGGDDPERLDVGDDPAPATSPSTVTTSTTTAAPVTSRPRPETAVGVLGDGRLVVIDIASGTITRELAAFDDPRFGDSSEPDEGGVAITDVVLHPNGRDVYFGTWGTAPGIFRLPLDGSAEPVRVVDGTAVTVSPDGRWLAYALEGAWGLFDLEAGVERLHRLPDGESSARVQFSPVSSNEIEVISTDFEPADDISQRPRVHTLDSDGGIASTRDGFLAWAGPNGENPTGGWSIEIVELDDGGTFLRYVDWRGEREGTMFVDAGLVFRDVAW